MDAFVVAMLDFVDEPAYRRYQAAFPGVFGKFNATLLAADEAPLLIDGDRPAPSKIVILQFPSREEAVRFTTDPDYARISKDRHAGAVTLSLLVSGLPPALVRA